MMWASAWSSTKPRHLLPTDRSSPGRWRGSRWLGAGGIALALLLLPPAGRALAAPGTNSAFVAPASGWDDLPPVAARPRDWPWWRGPALNNHAADGQQPPLHWSETNHVLWRVSLPGSGHATPCVWGDRVFLPSGDARTQRLWLFCLDRATGRQLWQTEIYRGPFPKIHENNSPASATPACDGERVFFAYQTDTAVRLAAVSLEGKVLWKETASPYQSVQGFSASPAIYKSAVIVPTDGSLGHELTALHRRTGAVIWRAPLRQVIESYASPLVARVAGRDQLFLIGGVGTHSYDPNNGALLWQCDGPAEFCAATVAFGENTVYATGGYPQRSLLALRADGGGDMSGTGALWKSDAKAGYVPSPLLHDGLLYAVSDTGLLRCYEAATGTVVWEHNFGAPFYSSPTRAGDRLYLFDRKGKGYAVRAGRAFDLLAENQLPSGAFASPVILDSRILLRTLGDVFCLGENVKP